MKKDYNAVDVTFVQDMIPHHEPAVKMAKVEISKGTNAEIAKLAIGIMNGQESEIEQMKKWLSDRGIAKQSDSKMSM